MALFFTTQVSRFLSSDQWVTHTGEVIRDIEHVLFQVQAAESSQRGYTASGQETYQASFQAALATLPAELNALQRATRDNPVQQRRFAELKKMIDTKLAIMERRFEQRRTLGAAALDPKYLDGSGRRSMSDLVGVGREMIELENSLLRERVAARDAGLHTAVAMLLVTSGLGAGLLFAGFLLTRRELRRSHTLGGALARANQGMESELGDRRRAQQRLGVQHSVARVAAENVSLAEAAPHFLQNICEHLDWDLGELWTVDPAANVMRLAERWHRPPESSAESVLVARFVAASRDWTFARGKGIPGHLWKAGAPSLWEHDLAASACFLRSKAAGEAGLRRAFAFALRAGEGNEVNSVMVFLSREQGAPDPELIATMDTLAGQIAQFAERCRAETGLRASQARFTAFMENAPAVAFIKDEEGRFLYGNQTLLRRFGLRAEEWLGKTDLDFWPEETPALRAHDRQVLAGEGAVELKESITGRDGRVSHWLSYKFPLYDEVTGRKLLAGMAIDITARELAESALRREREFLATLLDNLQASVVAFDAQGELTHCNRIAALFNGFSPDDPVPSQDRWGDYFELLPGNGGEPVRTETGPLAMALRGEMTRDQEFIIRLKNGQERAVSLNVTPFEDDRGQRLGAVAVAHDVTARREAREAALLSLREKETLLQEVHHRVKNNLQIIGSMLSMQARRTKSSSALAALRESAGRVKSIALVHEKLYRSADLECIDAADYLRTLSRNLLEALGEERLRLGGRVALDFELEDGHQIDASVAISTGLIVNEALTNSLKHGFPDERTGRVVVALTRLGDGAAPAADSRYDEERRPANRWLRLEIRDDGAGVAPAAFTPAGSAELARNSLGMRLVRDLSKQLGGRFKLLPTHPETGAGLTLQVDFPVGVLQLAG